MTYDESSRTAARNTGRAKINGWIGSFKRTSDKSLFPMALGSCGHRITHQLRPINMNGRSILAVTSNCQKNFQNRCWVSGPGVEFTGKGEAKSRCQVKRAGCLPLSAPRSAARGPTRREAVGPKSSTLGGDFPMSRFLFAFPVILSLQLAGQHVLIDGGTYSTDGGLEARTTPAGGVRRLPLRRRPRQSSVLPTEMGGTKS